MRILHTESSLGWGGQEIRVLTEARSVARRGHEVILATPAQARIFTQAPKYGIHALALPIARKGLTGLLALRRLLIDGDFEVVNTHSSTDSWLAAVACATGAGATRIVRTRHISSPVPDNASTRWLYAQAKHIVTTGEKLRLQVIRETQADASRVTSIPTGIDLERYRPGDRLAARKAVGLPEDKVIIGIVATLRSWKGHRYLIDAFAMMNRPDVVLVIVGDGPVREGLENQATSLGIGARTTFVGNQEDVAPWLQAFDLFCLPSYANEGVPQALMQAMACGLPVITTDVGSIGEIVTNGETGVMVTPQDEESLKGALATVIDDPGLRRRLGEAAAARAAERFGEARMTDAMIGVFSRACA